MKNLILYLAMSFGALATGCGQSELPSANSFKADLPPSAPPIHFGAPVKVLPELGFGYEPTVVVDRFGNVYSTSHKETWQLALAPDADSPTMTRSMSWARVSYDDGQTWKDLPGLTALSIEQHEPGDEGDMALDDAGHLYYADTYLADNTITGWTATGRGTVVQDYARPITPTISTLDDRPWITAHGDGHVFFMSNTATDNPDPAGSARAGSGYGPGHFTVFSSYDGGRNFEPLGYPLKSSVWCRPAADLSPEGVHYVYAACTGTGSDLYFFSSKDDGKSFERTTITNYGNGPGPVGSYPHVQVASDGSIYVMKVQAADGGNGLFLYRSKDHGQTWNKQQLATDPGRYIHVWLATAPNGDLGLGVYHKGRKGPWFVYGAVWKPGENPALVSLDPARPVGTETVNEVGNDYLGAYFGPDNKLYVIWTSPSDMQLSKDILIARSE